MTRKRRSALIKTTIGNLGYLSKVFLSFSVNRVLEKNELASNNSDKESDVSKFKILHAQIVLSINLIRMEDFAKKQIN